MAAIVGVRALKTTCLVTLYSDSDYLVTSMQAGLPGKTSGATSFPKTQHGRLGCLPTSAMKVATPPASPTARPGEPQP